MVSCATDTETRDISVEKALEDIRSGGKKLRGTITQIRNRFELELRQPMPMPKRAERVQSLKVAKLAVGR